MRDIRFVVSLLFVSLREKQKNNLIISRLDPTKTKPKVQRKKKNKNRITKNKNNITKYAQN